MPISPWPQGSLELPGFFQKGLTDVLGPSLGTSQGAVGQSWGGWGSWDPCLGKGGAVFCNGDSLPSREGEEKQEKP